jgi:hypothetical protein
VLLVHGWFHLQMQLLRIVRKDGETLVLSSANATPPVVTAPRSDDHPRKSRDSGSSKC